MSYKKLSLKAAIILMAAIMLPWQTLEAREQMRISRVGISQAIPYSYDVVGMVGDSLALFDFEVTNSSVTIKRGFVTPDAVVTPLQTIHTFTAPPDWETINGYPLYRTFKDGKLYSAFIAGDHSLVLITGEQGTSQHVFNHPGINMDFQPAYLIVNDLFGWCAHFNYPGGGPVKIYRIDLTTDTLQLFHEHPTTHYSGYSFYELADGYFLMTTYGFNDLPDLLVQGSQIVHSYPDGWWPYMDFYLMSSTAPVTDQLSYIGISDGLDRNQSWFMLAWVEDNDLITAGIPNSNPNPYSYGYIGSFVPYSSLSFSSVYGIGTSYPPDQRELNTFKNWQLNSGILEDIGGFPNLSAYPGAQSLFRLDDRFAVAISQVDQGPHSFCLIDYIDQTVRAYSYQVGYFGYTLHSDDHFYLIGYDGRVHCFALEMGSPNSDEQIPPANLELSAYPNPFRGSCSIEINCAKAGPAKLSVYNLRGQLVQTLHQELLTSGSHSIQWDASAHPSGVYFLRLEQGKEIITRKVLRLN